VLQWHISKEIGITGPERMDPGAIIAPQRHVRFADDVETMANYWQIGILYSDARFPLTNESGARLRKRV
jgi:hypothetical protein